MGTREVRNPPWVHPGGARAAPSAWATCGDSPISRASTWRRGVCDHVPGVPGRLRASGAHHGVRRCRASQRSIARSYDVLEPAGSEMACVQAAGACRQLPAHDVLHHRGRLDARLCGEKRLGRVRGARKVPRLPTSSTACSLTRCSLPCTCSSSWAWAWASRAPACKEEGRGARDEGHDDGPVRGARCPVRARGHAAGRGRGPAFLFDA